MCSARQLKSCSHDMSAHEHCPASDGAHACTQLCVSDRGFRPGNTSIVMSRAHACMASTHVLQTSMHASTHVDHADGCDIACCIRTLLGGGSQHTTGEVGLGWAYKSRAGDEGGEKGRKRGRGRGEGGKRGPQKRLVYVCTPGRRVPVALLFGVFEFWCCGLPLVSLSLSCLSLSLSCTEHVETSGLLYTPCTTQAQVHAAILFLHSPNETVLYKWQNA